MPLLRAGFCIVLEVPLLTKEGWFSCSGYSTLTSRNQRTTSRLKPYSSFSKEETFVPAPLHLCFLDLVPIRQCLVHRYFIDVFEVAADGHSHGDAGAADAEGF